MTASAQATSPAEITVVDADGEHVRMRIAGELDLSSADHLRAVLDEQMAEGRRYFRIDLSDMTFCDSTGIGTFVRAHRLLLRRGGTIVLTGVPRTFAKLLELTHLNKVLLWTPQPDAWAVSADS